MSTFTTGGYDSTGISLISQRTPNNFLKSVVRAKIYQKCLDQIRIIVFQTFFLTRHVPVLAIL